MKAFEDYNSNLAKVAQIFFDRVENIEAKGENAGYQYISFSHNVFKRPLLKIHWPFPKQALVFTWLQYKSFENTVGKGETARNGQFLHFPHCFLPF